MRAISRITGASINTVTKLLEDAGRQNLTMRMSMRRFTRLANAHSKKLANYHHAQALYFMYYNFARINQPVRVSPAMAAGIEARLWEIEDIVALIDARAEIPECLSGEILNPMNHL